MPNLSSCPEICHPERSTAKSKDLLLNTTTTAECPIHTPALSADEWNIRAKAQTALPSLHHKSVISTEA